MQKRLILTIMLVAALGMGAAYWRKMGGQRETAQATRGRMEQIVTAPGTIKAKNTAYLRFGSTGRLVYLPYEVNDEVKKGAVVATIDVSDLRAVQTKELKDFEEARRNLDRIAEEQEDLILNDEQKRDLADKQAALDRTIIDVEIADRARKNASLYTPFAGVVTEVNGEINEWTNALSTQPLVTVVDFGTIYFEARVSEENSGLIREGQPVKIVLDAQNGETLSGTVSEVARRVTKNADGENVVAVEIALTQNGNELKLGLEGDAQIIVDERTDLLLVGKRAVVKSGNEAYVTVKEGNRFHRRPVVLGAYDGISWEIKDGLTEAEIVVLPK